uniref:Uncharacterized protein n=1 Tax=Timema genevievae TaxID=629358 RepID=A0A7R9K2Q5_TIMGE|nr:unnamed protein product [Timema genevievae]
MWHFKWLRRLMRRHTRPIPQPKANQWRNRLSIAYALLAWNAFGLVCYMVYTGRKDWAKYYGLKTEDDDLLSPGVQWAKTLKISNAKVMRVSGMQLEHRCDILEGEIVEPNPEEQKLS